ncbi:MAG TPA: type II secretion system protein N [Halothiobacillus sp.]|nr:type II secretion system protein N [Halothiobacillus sp.]
MTLSMGRTEGDVTKAAAGSRGVWVLGAIFVLSWLGALVFTAPLSLIRLPSDALPAGVTLVPRSGTLWWGQWQLDLSQGASVHLTTRFMPGALLHGQLSWRVVAQGAGLQAEAVVTPGQAGVSIDRLQAQLAADSPLMQAATPWPLGGVLSGTGAVVLQQTAQGLLPMTATISLQWQAARLTTTEPLSLGDLALSAKVDHGQLAGTLTTLPSVSAPLKGTLNLNGGLVSGPRLRIRGFLEATSHASPALRQQLGLLGRPAPDGRTPIDGYLPGR